MAEGKVPSAAYSVKLSQDQQRQRYFQRPLSRTSSLPVSIDAVGTKTPEPPMVSLNKPAPPEESLSPLRHSRLSSQKKAQQWRTSLAVTNSDYYSQWRPKMSSLAMLHGSTIVRNIQNAPSLDVISENEMQNSELMNMEEKEELVADPNMFRYTPTRVLEGLPSSRSSTPQAYTTQPNRQLPLTLGDNPEHHTESSSAVVPPKDFLPLYLNKDHEKVYIFRDGCYIPLMNMKETGEPLTKISQSKLNAPLIQNRRHITTSTPPHDLFKCILVVMIVFLVCLDVPVALLLLLPSLAFSMQVKKKNSYGQEEEAQKCAEWSRCCCITAILFHVLFSLLIALTLLLLHFLGRLF